VTAIGVATVGVIHFVADAGEHVPQPVHVGGHVLIDATERHVGELSHGPCDVSKLGCP
jgi:hypothetical protein